VVAKSPYVTDRCEKRQGSITFLRMGEGPPKIGLHIFLKAFHSVHYIIYNAVFYYVGMGVELAPSGKAALYLSLLCSTLDQASAWLPAHPLPKQGVNIAIL
jgi:hypothetical protein